MKCLQKSSATELFLKLLQKAKQPKYFWIGRTNDEQSSKNHSEVRTQVRTLQLVMTIHGQSPDR